MRQKTRRDGRWLRARNQLDSLIYTTEKSLKEFGDKVDSGEKQNIEDAIAKAKKAMETNDVSAIKSAQEELTRSSHKLAEAMYAKASQEGNGRHRGPKRAPGRPAPKGPGGCGRRRFRRCEEK